MNHIRLPVFIIILILFNSCYVARAYKFRKFNLNDHEKLASVTIQKSTQPLYFIQPSPGSYKEQEALLDSNLANSETAAFLVIRNDTVIYEKYFNQFSSSSKLPSFSVAKSFVGTLIGIAIDEGYIKNTDEPVTKYIPELLKTDKRYNGITIQDVLDMKTDLAYTEKYNNPTSDVIQLGFRNDIRKKVLKIKAGERKGEFEYQSINTQILSFILEKATGKTTQQYLQEKIWQPLGMESNATWNIDGHEEVRAFCCLNATARDFAKFGLLYLNKGKWNGRQIVSEKWVETIAGIDNSTGDNRYKNQWWKSKGSAYQAQGVLGQYIFVDPSKNLVIVRLGHNWKHPKFRYIGRFISFVDDEL